MTTIERPTTVPQWPRASADMVIGDRRTTILLAGDVDESLHEDLRVLIADAIAIHRPVALDLHAVRSLCPRTVELLVELGASTPRGLTVVSATAPVRRLLQLIADGRSMTFEAR